MVFYLSFEYKVVYNGHRGSSPLQWNALFSGSLQQRSYKMYENAIGQVQKRESKTWSNKIVQKLYYKI